jgi:hypothetical protein
MNLRKCPACKNIISRDTDSCPICGCEPAKRRLRQIITYTLILGCGAWATQHYCAKRIHWHHQSGDLSGNTRIAISSR